MSQAINYVAKIDGEIAANEPMFQSVFKEYERVIIETLITSFGLDFIITDRHGGDVDTIHNVREIDNDPKMHYKSKRNEQAYDERAAYDQTEYHAGNTNYNLARKKMSDQQTNHELTDVYTGELLTPDDKFNVEHKISAKEIHNDRGRVLSGLNGSDLANSEQNLAATHESINKSKQDKSVDEFLDTLNANSEKNQLRIEKLKSKNELSEQEQKELRKLEALQNVDHNKAKHADKKSRADYEAKLARAYYTSPQFAKDVALSAGKVGLQMGVKQSLGIVFAEIWFAVKAEFENDNSTDDFDLGAFLEKVGKGFQVGYENAKNKYKDIFDKFLQGGIAGGLASLTTTLCNIFLTTAKNIVKLIRMSYASVIEASKILFLNPDNLLLGERFRATTKILATGASIIAGVLVSELIESTPLGAVPIIGDIVQTFCGALVTGILSCTLLMFLDRSKTMNKLVNMIDTLPCIEKDIAFYKEQADLLEKYAAELMNIDLDSLQKEICLISEISASLESASNDNERNRVLKKAIKDLNIRCPWGNGKFDEFMSDKNNRLVFQ